MTQYTLQASTPSHTDITRLRAGHVGGQVYLSDSRFFKIKNDLPHSFGRSIRVVYIKERMQQLVLWNKSM